MAAFFTDAVFLSLLSGGCREAWAWSGLAAWLWALAARRPGRAPLFWILYLAWSALSALACPEPLVSLPALAKASAGPALLFATSGRFGEAARARWSLMLGASCLALGAASGLLHRPGYGWAGLLYPYKNYTGAVLAAGFAACLGAWDSGRPPKPALAGLMAFCLALIAGMGSRGAALGCASAGALWLIRTGRTRILAAACALALGALALLPGPALVRALKLDHPSSPVRARIWSAAWGIVRENPWLGTGPGRFERAFLRHNFPAPDLPGAYPARYGLSTAYAHSEPLQAASETGVPGLALWVLALASGLAPALRAPRRPGREGALLACAALLAQSLFDNVLALPGMSLLFFSALAACGTGRPAARVPRALPACFCALSLLAWWPGWALRDSMRRSRAAGAPAAVARDQALKALRLAPGDCFAWENLSRARLRGPWPDPAGAARALREARRLNPTNAAFALQLADLARLRGDWALCGREAAEALDLEPRCLRARLLLCIALGRQGRLLPSREAFAPAPALRRELAALRDLKGYDAAVLGVDEALYAEASSAAGG